jgi:hypothetical protein
MSGSLGGHFIFFPFFFYFPKPKVALRTFFETALCELIRRRRCFVEICDLDSIPIETLVAEHIGTEREKERERELGFWGDLIL